MKKLPVGACCTVVFLWLTASVSLLAQTIPPYSTGFETTGGYSLGNLAAQDGWQVTAGAALVTNDTAFAGTFSVGLQPGSLNANITHAFAQMSGASVTWIDFETKLTVAATFANTASILAEGSGIGLIRLDSVGHIVVFDGDGQGSGRWVVTGRSMALNGSGQSMAWVRVTIRQDYSAKKWDLYINGQLVLHDIGLRDNTKTFLSQFSLVTASIATAYFDAFSVSSACPIFTDADNDGMDDSWETAHGLNTAINDRNTDHDGDGLTNIEEFALGTDPNSSSTKGDGIADGWKVTHGLDPLGTVVATDPGNVGRTVLQSFQQNLSLWPTPTVASGLQFWLRADAGIVKDGSSNIVSWKDISGRSLGFTQADVTRQPVWVPSAVFGQPAVQFNGSAFLRTPAPVDEQLGSSDITIIAVAVPGATQPAYSSLVDLSSDTNRGFVAGQVGNNTNQFQFWFTDAAQTGWYSGPVAATTAGQVQIISLIKSGASASSYLNGISQGTGTVPAAMLNPIAALAVGNRASGNYGYNGQLAEVLVYNRALTDTERSQIEQALKVRYINPDADGNGLTDAWELQYLGVTGNDPASDPGGVGRTLLQSFRQNLSPWPAPLVSSGLRSWFRAGLGLTKDGANKVSSWTDLSGNGAHVRQPTDASRQPAWVASAMNGLPAVQFDGTTYLKTSGAVDELAGSTDVTVITVAVPGATQPAYSSLVDLSSDTAHGFVVGQVGNSTNQFQLWFMDAAQSGWYSGPAAGTSAGLVQVISVVKNGTAAAAYLNGVSQGTGTVPQSMLTPAAALAVGNRASGNYGYNGQIAEVLVYNRALSNAERAQIETALQTKYISTDADGNGLPDAWEKQYFGKTGNDPVSDPGSVGRTLLQSFQQGLSPWPVPTVASGLRAWYRADLGLTKDSSNKLSGWDDLSGQSNHLIQTSDLTRQPLFVASAISGKPAVHFDGTTFVKTGSAVDEQAGNTDVTVIAVAVPATTQPAYASLVDLSSDTAHGFVVGQVGSNTNQFQLWFMDAAQSGWYSGPAATTTAGQVQIVSVVKNGTSASSFLNGASQGSGTVPQAMLAPVAALAVGNRASGNYGYNGQIAEVLIYNRALTGAERQQVEAALTTRYLSNPDSDGNGLPDAWELQYFGHIGVDPNADFDGDGLTNLQEFQAGTNPTNADTDGDGVGDGLELRLGRNPTKGALPDTTGAVNLRVFQPTN